MGTSLRRGYEEVLGIVRTVRFTADGGVSEIVTAPDGDIGEDLLRVLWSAHGNDIDIVPIQAVHEQTLQRLPIRYMKPGQVLASLARGIPVHPVSAALQRVIDLAAGLHSWILSAFGSPSKLAAGPRP